MNLVSIFSFKMPLQILYLSAGFKKHLSNQVLSRRRILSGGSAEPCQLQGLLAPARALQRFAVQESWGISMALPQPLPAEHHCFPTGFLHPSGLSKYSQTYYAQFAARTQSLALPVPSGSLLYPSPGQTLPLVLLQGAACSATRDTVTKRRCQPQFSFTATALILLMSLIRGETSEHSPDSGIGISLQNLLLRDGLEKCFPPCDRGSALQQTLLRALKCRSGVTLSCSSLPLLLRFCKGSSSNGGLADSPCSSKLQ